MALVAAPLAAVLARVAGQTVPLVVAGRRRGRAGAAGRHGRENVRGRGGRVVLRAAGHAGAGGAAAAGVGSDAVFWMGRGVSDGERGGMLGGV